VSAAATFGLTENERGKVKLTTLGRRIADPAQEAAARADAFLTVPLYSRVYENFKGYTLPGAAAIEKYMRDVGVSSKQLDKARQVFLRSARQANFFEHGDDRLVRPAAPSNPGTPPVDLEPKKDPPEDLKNRNGGNGGGDPPPIDPIIEGLLKRLPKTGDVWPEADRKLWLQLLEGSFKLIYKDAAPPLPWEGQPQTKDESGLLEAASKLAWRDEGQK
jgi:hypothetical protein